MCLLVWTIHHKVILIMVWLLEKYYSKQICIQVKPSKVTNFLIHDNQIHQAPLLGMYSPFVMYQKPVYYFTKLGIWRLGSIWYSYHDPEYFSENLRLWWKRREMQYISENMHTVLFPFLFWSCFQLCRFIRPDPSGFLHRYRNDHIIVREITLKVMG